MLPWWEWMTKGGQKVREIIFITESLWWWLRTHLNMLLVGLLDKGLTFNLYILAGMKDITCLLDW